MSCYHTIHLTSEVYHNYIMVRKSTELSNKWVVTKNPHDSLVFAGHAPKDICRNAEEDHI